MRARTVRSTLTIAGLTLAVFGCGDSASEEGLEQVIEEQSGGDVDVDLDEGGMTFESEDGSMTVDEDGSFTVTGEDGEVISGEGDGEGNLTIEGEEGSFTVEQGGDIPEEWPDEVPTPDDLEITSSSVIDAPEGAAITLSGSVEDAEAFIESYGAALEASGFTNEGEFSSDESSSAVFSSDEWQVSVGTTSFDGETQGNVSVFPASS